MKVATLCDTKIFLMISSLSHWLCPRLRCLVINNERLQHDFFFVTNVLKVVCSERRCIVIDLAFFIFLKHITGATK